MRIDLLTIGAALVVAVMEVVVVIEVVVGGFSVDKFNSEILPSFSLLLSPGEFSMTSNNFRSYGVK